MNNENGNNIKPTPAIKQERVRYLDGVSDEYIELELPSLERPDRLGKSQLSHKNCLERLGIILQRVLLSEPCSQEELNCLSRIEREILKAFFIKKKVLLDVDELRLDFEFFNQYYRVKTERRKEENLKHVFMMGMKFLRTQFRRRTRTFKFRKEDVEGGRKELVDLAFYISYFGQIADEKGWSIERFFHPKISSKRKKGKPETERFKSINLEYTKLVKMSDRFIGDFTKFLNDDFKVTNSEDEKVSVTGIKKQTKEVLEDKLVSKINYWDEIIRKFGDDKGISRVVDELTKNPKCKLPWSRKELDTAIGDVRKLFQLGTSE